MKIKARYDGWIRDAPQKYKDDSFILDRRPIIVTSQYGQNQAMLGPGDVDSWRNKRSYEKVHYMSVAIATHLRYLSTSIYYPTHIESLQAQVYQRAFQQDLTKIFITIIPKAYIHHPMRLTVKS